VDCEIGKLCGPLSLTTNLYVSLRNNFNLINDVRARVLRFVPYPGCVQAAYGVPHMRLPARFAARGRRCTFTARRIAMLMASWRGYFTKVRWMLANTLVRGGNSSFVWPETGRPSACTQV